MLSSLFGWGNMGFMADILGVMFNIILLLVIVSLISHLWRKFRGKKNTSDDDAYRRGYEAAMREERFRHKGNGFLLALFVLLCYDNWHEVRRCRRGSKHDASEIRTV